MNKIAYKFFQTRDKFMPELHLRQPVFVSIASLQFTKYRETIRIFRETGSLRYLYKNKLDKAFFAHDAAYSESKGLAKRTISDKILKNQAY